MTFSGANGNVKFNVDGLPNGVYLNGDTIVVSQNADSGNHIIKATATDSLGRVAERIVNLGIVVASESSSSSSSSSSSYASSTSDSTYTSSSTSSTGSGAFGNYGISGNSGSSSGSVG